MLLSPLLLWLAPSYNARMLKPERIAIFLPNWVGDVAMATPALRAARGHWPKARIVHVGRSLALDTLAGTPWADGRIVDNTRVPPQFRNFLGLIRELRREHFDLAILLPNSFRSAGVARLAGASRIAGYDRDGRGWLLSDKLQPQRDGRRFVPVPTIEYYNDLLRRLGAEVESNRMELPVTEADEAAAEALLQECGVSDASPRVMLNPGASFGVSKMWAPRRYAQLADALADKCGAQIIINAAPSERDIAAEVASNMKHAPAVNFADRGNSLGLLKSLLRRCDLLVTNDTGARHLAAAMGSAVVTIFGSTDPTWARIDYPRERIVRVDVPCSPCQQKQCRLPQGPQFHQCMKAITVEMVLEPAMELLSAGPRGGSA
jgi:heptosyltransferase-2